MTDQKRESWTLVHRQGFWRLVVVHGIFRFGLPFATITFLVRHLAFGDSAGFPRELYRFAFSAVLFGGGMTLWAWRSNMKRYAVRDEAASEADQQPAAADDGKASE